MPKKTRQPGKLVRLTTDERRILNRALRTVSEDGSVYGGYDDDEKIVAKVNAQVEALSAKLKK